MQRARSFFVYGPVGALKRKRRARAGAAMVEAAIAMPVLIMLLVGATYLRELYLARASTRLTARSCAWAHAMDGCRGSMPSACEGSMSAAHGDDVPQLADKVRVQVGSASDPFRDVPVVGEALASLFGEATHARADATVPYPFDAQRVGMATAETVVVCNTVPTSVLDLAKELLCDHVGC
jgi:hypothetical protein